MPEMAGFPMLGWRLPGTPLVQGACARNQRQRNKRLLACAALVALIGAARLPLYGQRPQDLVTPTPLKPGEFLILGFMGGRDRWDDDRRGVRKLALKLRSRQLPGVHVETVENMKRGTALELVRRALDRNRDGRLDAEERRSVPLILYGQSFGGAAVVKFARQLEKLDVPVLLTVQVDSVGWGDEVIPSNVAHAANLYQRERWFIRGEPAIRAEDAQKTVIVGNFRSHYRGKNIDLSGIPWHQRLFRTAHTKMDQDPDVWTKVEELILGAVRPQPPK